MPISQHVVNSDRPRHEIAPLQIVARSMSLSLGGVKIKQDLEGRYCLNDLHKAAGKEKRHAPGYWLAIQQAAELVAELETTGIPVVTIEGRNGGTFVMKELVYAYAMWVSAKFNLQVIRTFDAVVVGHIQLVEGKQARERARLEAPALTDAIKHGRAVAGKEVKHYHFSNEFDLINRIALGMPSKAYRVAHCISPTDSIRDHLTPCEIRCIEHLQRVNASLIDVGMDFESRKQKLSQIYIQRHKRALLSEIKQLEF
ncbi:MULTISPECIES: KilA-N domain-containing protein [Pseudomonas syringae group]|uniref:KilA-N domain-containing protein n=1 Tax=Pseudomonas syringae group TaxID=136849 RepID=UPI0001E29834|nr:MULTISPECIES: KilA-N domain-containing protein [Pseudomonas syringae group]MBM1212842.1 KilA-N domain-containing protein [Pseudomonas syringae]MBM1218490.1 KilA-N domain-containing protein [Pseudomonas syringae]MBX6404102.1 KilA-N domain-containing protein [Pseudomonas syringae pv. tomato]MBX6410893.1 KilA-N domain-containing protein [Pseudomonas syringae pv. tomato]MBX6430135.1 KilA-N domain-containing protein [Pseudomonas syringae pv. tomato]